MKLLLAFTGAAIGIGVFGLVTAPSIAQAPASSAQVFGQCRACHTVEKGGRNGIGPNLNGVFTRPAASVPGYTYSPALKKAGLKWDDKTLSTFLAGPQKLVPGTRMPIGVADPAKRAAIIAYLKAETAK
jgi:cytochrome c